MQAEQLELDFSSLMKRAKTSFSVEHWKTDWTQLRFVFNTEIEEASINERMAVEVNAIVELAEVIYLRASQLGSFSTIEVGEIAFEEDFFDLYLAEPQTFDPNKYLLKDRLYQRSQVTNLTKEQALAFASEPEPEQAEVEVVEAIEALEYDENIAAWAAIVREWMVAVGVDSVSISELVDSTELSSVKAWLAGLLGDFELEQTKDFYSFDGLVLRTELVAREVA